MWFLLIGFINTHPLALKHVLSKRSRKQIILPRLVSWSSHMFSYVLKFLLWVIIGLFGFFLTAEEKAREAESKRLEFEARVGDSVSKESRVSSVFMCQSLFSMSP